MRDQHPHPASREHVAAAAGYEAGGGHFQNTLGRLRTLELVTGKTELSIAAELADN